MGAVRFSGVAGSHDVSQALAGERDSAQSIMLFSQDGYHLQVDGVDFGDTSVMTVGVETGPAQGRIFQQHRSGLLCIFILTGNVLLDDGTGCPATAGPDSCWTIDHSPGVRLTWASPGKAIIAVVPRQVVRDFGLVPVAGPRRLPAGSTLLEPTRGFISSLVTGADKISSVAAYFMEKLVHEMVGGLFLEESTAVAGHANRPTLYHQAMALITASAAEQSLTPESLAKDLSVSLRHLQRDFQKRNESVADTIRRTRADLAVRLLSDPAMTVLSLDQVAEHSGFASLGHLRRTLQSIGAGTPREIRASRLSGEQAGSLLS